MACTISKSSMRARVSDAQVEQVIIQTLESTTRRETLVHPRFSEVHRTKPHDHQQNLACLRPGTASHRYVQAVVGPNATAAAFATGAGIERS